MSKPIQVKRLQSKHSGKAAQTTIDAFENNPLTIYIKKAPDAKEPSPAQKRITLYAYQANLTDSIAHKIVLTVDEGNAIAVLAPVPKAPAIRVLNSVNLRKFLNRVWQLMTLSPEQRKRSKEIQDRFSEMVERIMGDKVNEAMYLDALATAPALQGRGYGTALMQAVKDIAQQQRRGIWLLSTDDNTEFYKFQGFHLAGVDLIGLENPTWHEPPFVVTLMTWGIPVSDTTNASEKQDI